MDEALSVRDYWFGHERVTAETLSRRMRMWFSEDAPEERERLSDARIGAPTVETADVEGCPRVQLHDRLAAPWPSTQHRWPCVKQAIVGVRAPPAGSGGALDELACRVDGTLG